VKLNKII